ncbi:MAG: hypothetical protein M1819_000506 [Sarea resinae]|nr:MAG: hypothetical protein M1819_000506 [Sarea resinae]
MSSFDPAKDLVLITCASGAQASHLLPIVVGKWKRLRLAVNSPSSEERLKKAYPGAEVIRANLEEPHETKRLLKGVATVFHIGPTYHPRETEIGYNMIEAALEGAKDGTFKHFVLSSALSTQLSKMKNHDCKRLVEEYLFESDLAYTVVQPCAFMTNLPLSYLLSLEKPVYPANWDPKVPFSYIALEDFGQVVARIVEEREHHYYAQYPLVGTTPINTHDVVATFSKAIGKPIAIHQNSFEEGVNMLLTILFGPGPHHPYTRDSAERMLLYYNRRGLVGNPNVLEWLLGKKATTLEQWSEKQVQNAKSK